MDSSSFERDIQTMRSANAAGHLGPIAERLDRMIEAAAAPEKIEGPEWPYKQAERGGRYKALVEFRQWIEQMVSVQPAQHDEPPEGA